MKSSINKITYILVMMLMACGQPKTNTYDVLQTDDLLYDVAHLFAHCYDGNELVQLHLYNSFCHRYYLLDGGPDALTITRGNKKNDYKLRFYKNSSNGPSFSLYNENEDKCGIVTFCYNDDEPFGTITINKEKKIRFDSDLFINVYEDLIPWDDNEAAIQLIDALNNPFRAYQDWPIDVKNLSLLLHRNLEFGKQVDFTPLNDDFDIIKSPDGFLTSFLINYTAGGNGAGAYFQRTILQYWSEGVNHVIEDFDDWISEDGRLLGYNFPNLIRHNILASGLGDDIIYFFEYTYYDQMPVLFDDNEHEKEYINLLGAFRIIDGSIVPVKIIKSKNALLSQVVVESDTEEARFKLDNKKGLLGVPLIETNDYQHHDKYLIYEWNSKTGLFEYNGKIDKM